MVQRDHWHSIYSYEWITLDLGSKNSPENAEKKLLQNLYKLGQKKNILSCKA